MALIDLAAKAMQTASQTARDAREEKAPADPYGFNLIAGFNLPEPTAPEIERHESALKKYGLPIALAGIAYALGQRDGEGPEAAVSALSGYMKGSMAAGERRKADREKKEAEARQQRRDQLAYLGQIMPMLTPESAAGVAGTIGNAYGMNVSGLQMANPAALQAKRDEQLWKQQERQLIFQAGIGQLGSKDPRTALNGIELLRKTSPELGPMLDRMAGVFASDQEDAKQARKVILSAIGNAQSPGALARILPTLAETLPPSYQDELMDLTIKAKTADWSAQAAADRPQATPRLTDPQRKASVLGKISVGQPLGTMEEIGEAQSLAMSRESMVMNRAPAQAEKILNEMAGEWSQRPVMYGEVWDRLHPKKSDGTPKKLTEAEAYAIKRDFVSKYVADALEADPTLNDLREAIKRGVAGYLSEMPGTGGGAAGDSTTARVPVGSDTTDVYGW